MRYAAYIAILVLGIAPLAAAIPVPKAEAGTPLDHASGRDIPVVADPSGGTRELLAQPPGGPGGPGGFHGPGGPRGGPMPMGPRMAPSPPMTRIAPPPRPLPPPRPIPPPPPPRPLPPPPLYIGGGTVVTHVVTVPEPVETAPAPPPVRHVTLPLAEPVVVNPPPPENPAPALPPLTAAPTPAGDAPPQGNGHYEVRTVTTPAGERYEERTWVPDP